MKVLLEDPVTASDKTFLSLRSAIVEGDIPAGAKLSETELSNNFKVSRAIVREAINRLESSSLVERKPNVGARVVALTLEGMIELYQVREALEGMAARLAATQMSNDEIADLQSVINSHDTSTQNGRLIYHEAGDVDFHYRIILGSNNTQLISLLTNNIYHLIRMYRVQHGMSGPRVNTALDEHRAIVQAIANRDPELAELLMRRHIAYTKESLRAKLSQ